MLNKEILKRVEEGNIGFGPDDIWGNNSNDGWKASIEIVKKEKEESIKDFLNKEIKPKLKSFKRDIDNFDVVKVWNKYYLVKYVRWKYEKIFQIEWLNEQEFINLSIEFQKLKKQIKEELKELKKRVKEQTFESKEKGSEDLRSSENLRQDLYLIKQLSEKNRIENVKYLLEKRWIIVDFDSWYKQLKEKIAYKLLNSEISVDQLRKEAWEQFVKDVILYILNKDKERILDIKNKYILNWKRHITNRWEANYAREAIEDIAFLKALASIYSPSEFDIILKWMWINSSQQIIKKFVSFDLTGLDNLQWDEMKSFINNQVSILKEYMDEFGDSSPIRQYRLALENFEKVDWFVKKVVSWKVSEQDFEDMWESIEKKWLFWWVDYAIDRLETHTKVSPGEAQFLRYLGKAAVLIWLVKLVWDWLGKIKWLDSWRKKLLALWGVDIIYNIGTWHHLWEFSWRLFTGDFTKDYYVPFYKGEKHKQRKEVAELAKKSVENTNVDIVEIAAESIPDIEKVSLISMWFADMKLEDFLKYKKKDWWNIDWLKEFLKSKSDNSLYYHIFEKVIQDREGRVYLKNCLDITYKYFVNYPDKNQKLWDVYKEFDGRYKDFIKEKEKLKKYLEYDCKDDKSCMKIKQKLKNYIKDIQNNYLFFKVNSLSVIKSKYKYQDILSYFDKLMDSTNSVSNNDTQTKRTQSGQNSNKTSSSKTSSNGDFSGQPGIL